MTFDDDRLLLAVRALIVLLCGAALLLIVVILSGSKLDDTSGRAIGTAVAFAAYSLTAMAGAALVTRRPPLALFGYGVAGVSLLAFLTAVVAIWSDPGGEGWELPATLFAFALGGGHASLLLKGARDDDPDTVRAVRAMVLGTIAALCLMAWIEITSNGPDLDPRLLGVTAVLYLLGIGLLPLARRASPPAARGQRRSAPDLLRDNGHVLVEGPNLRAGAHGSGQSVCLREPDGTLIEIITYGHTHEPPR
jgi:hypothetical protein